MPPITPNHPTAAEVRAALKVGAGQHTAILSAKTSERAVAETLTALANAQGGLVALDAGASAEEAQQRMQAAALLAEPPLILPQPEWLEIDDKIVCLSYIPPGLPHVYSVKGQYLIRSGRNNRPLLPDELRRLLLNRSEAGFEAQVIEGANSDDLDATRIAAYQTQLGLSPTDPATDLLLSRGCLARTAAGGQASMAWTRPTMAGLVLLGREPQRWLRSAEITCVRYVGDNMSDDFVREDVRGVLPDQIRRAEAFVSANMRRGMRIRSLARDEVLEYPISVVREAIVNAVAHRDYSIRGDNIRVLMFGDRLEVYSPGRLPGHVTLDNLLDERYSRNEAIVQALSEMGFIERLGYGIDRMIAVCEQEGLNPPRFEETAAGFKVTIFGHGPSLIGAAPPTSLWASLHLNPRQEQMLTFLQDNRRIASRDYQQLCPDASPETLRRDFAELVDRGILLKIGEKRATYYVLK